MPKDLRFNTPNTPSRAKKKPIPPKIWDLYTADIVREYKSTSSIAKVAQIFQHKNILDFTPSAAQLRKRFTITRRLNDVEILAANGANAAQLPDTATLESNTSQIENNANSAEKVGKLIQPLEKWPSVEGLFDELFSDIGETHELPSVHNVDVVVELIEFGEASMGREDHF